MEHSHNHSEGNGNNESWLFSRTGIATIVAVSVLGFLIYTGHGAHLLGWLPFLLIGLCPLMHIFMHGGHGGHSHGGENTSQNSEPTQKSANTKQQDNQKSKNHKHGGC